MITYDIETRGKKGIYEFIYESIRRDIILGNLKSGEKLPSKRVFASNHGISVVSVENAYAQLLAEGYIYSVPKSGFFISDLEILGELFDTNRLLEDDKKVKSERFGKSIDQTANTVNASKITAINLISNHTDPDRFPFSIWAKIVRDILSAQNDNLLISPPTAGVYELRNAIANHLRQFRGMDIDAEQIIIGAGTEYLYGLIIQLLGREYTYGLENPCSTKIRKIYESQGVKTENLLMDEEGVIPNQEGLEETNVLQISPSHQFPTGIVSGVGRRLSILSWVYQKDDRYVIEDDFDSEFRLQGHPVPTLFSMDNRSKVIYFNTFSKSLASTIRISYMVLPKDLLDRFEEKLGFYSCTVSNFEQYTLARFIENGYFEKHINRIRKQCREVRDGLINSIMDSAIGKDVQILEKNSGLHFLMKINTDKTDEELKVLAKEKGVVVGFLSEYTTSDRKKDYEHIAIINYSGVKESMTKEVVVRINEAWR